MRYRDAWASSGRVGQYMSTLSSPVNDPAYWRQRAEETRTLADQLDDPVAKQTMLEIALAYEQVAAFGAARPLAHEPQ